MWKKPRTQVCLYAIWLCVFMLTGRVQAREQTREQTPDESAIHQAARDGDVEKLKKILAANPALLNHREKYYGRTPLHNAAHFGHPEAVAFLLARGAEVDALSGWSRSTPLLFATHLGWTCPDQKRKKEVAELLLAKGASVSIKGGRNDAAGMTPLNRAAYEGNLAVVKLLLAHGANIETKTIGRQTPFMSACKQGKLKVVRFLISKGAKIHLKMRYNITPLMLAVSSGVMPLVDLLLQHKANEKATTKSGLTVSHYAAGSGSLTMVKRFPPTPAMLKNPHQATFLLNATLKGGTGVVEYFLKKGCNVNAVSPLGTNGTTPLHNAARYRSVKTVELLLKYGARVKVKNSRGKTPLHLACRYNSLAVVKLLLAHKANPNARDNRGKTVLYDALRSGTPGLTKLLCENNAQVNVSNGQYMTPLHFATYYANIEAVKVLLEHGAYTRIENLQGKIPAQTANKVVKSQILPIIKGWETSHPQAMKTRLPLDDKSAYPETMPVAIKNFKGKGYAIVIVPIGKVDMDLLAEMQRSLKRLSGISVFIDKVGFAPLATKETTREVGKNHHRQWNAKKLMVELMTYVGYHGRHNIGVIGILAEDLYPPRGNFVFALSSPGEAIISYSRFRAGGREKLLKRLANQAVASTGSIFGIRRCRNKLCMRGRLASLAMHDQKGNDLGPWCRNAFTKKFGVVGRSLDDNKKNKAEDDEDDETEEPGGDEMF